MTGHRPLITPVTQSTGHGSIAALAGMGKEFCSQQLTLCTIANQTHRWQAKTPGDPGRERSGGRIKSL